ncbi:MAG: PQQ-like beta-propeller repeat protein [Pirellulales bacterium]|nr:PQQ-like beta-propeller repeat protein [Pirellulales bacterium]
MSRVSIAALVLLLFAGQVARSAAEDWPCWRGPRGDGTSLEPNVPTTWSGTENVAWKVPIAGRGHSSPIIWQDRLFLVTCLEESQERVLMGLDRRDGRELWRRTVVTAPLEEKHPLNSYASSTPATDGELVYVTFLEGDQMVVAAYDFAGQQRWLVRPGSFHSKHGYSSCPVLFEDLVIVNGDHDGDSFVVALDRASGATRWKIDRENKTRSYSVPLIREFAGQTQMLLSGNKCVSSYDPRTGERRWVLAGPTEQFVASLVNNDELVFMTCGFPDHHILAIRPTGAGQLTDDHIVWRTIKGASYVPSPIVIGPYFLIVADNGIASCFDAASGKRHWMERIGARYSASLVAAGGLAYFLSDDGVMTVVRPGPEFEQVAENALGEETYASPAISRGQVFLRGVGHLYCIGPRS